MVLLVGTNPRLEAPVLNARLRKRWLAGALRIGVIGEQADLTYGYDYLGAGPAALSGPRQGQGRLRQGAEGRQEPGDHRRRRARWRGPTARRC